jgi:sirohydrochlorin ferrochelatase
MLFRSMLFITAALGLVACAHKSAATPEHVHAHEAPRVAEVGFVVAAPDRGFLGNEEVADAVDAFARTHAASVVFVTDQRTTAELVIAVDGLAARGVKRVVVLPLFLSRAERGFQ